MKMNMTLSVFERLILLNILPAEGDITTIRIVRTLREALSFSEEEHKALEFTREDGTVRWKSDGERAKEIIIGSKARSIVAERLKTLNEQKKLTESHLPIWERFCDDNQAEVE